VLIYERTKKVYYQDDASKAMIKKMKGRLKAYFAARMNGTRIEIFDEVSGQGW
jgi:hypothetical protein